MRRHERRQLLGVWHHNRKKQWAILKDNKPGYTGLNMEGRTTVDASTGKNSDVKAARVLLDGVESVATSADTSNSCEVCLLQPCASRQRLRSAQRTTWMYHDTTAAHLAVGHFPSPVLPFGIRFQTSSESEIKAVQKA